MTAPNANQSAEHIDASYTKFCTTMTVVGEDNALHFLCRFALLSIVRHTDGAFVEKIIDDASSGLTSGNHSPSGSAP